MCGLRPREFGRCNVATKAKTETDNTTDETTNTAEMTGATVEDVVAMVGRGEPIPTGWTFDPKANPFVYKTSDGPKTAEKE